MRIVLIAGVSLLAAAGAASSPASAQSRWDGRPGTYRLVGPGVPLLFPELRDNPRGRAFVARNFDWNHDAAVEVREAEAANRAFAEVAGPNRARFDWNHPVVIARPAPVSPPPAVVWDRRAMHEYGFRQTTRGATLNLSEDVLFATDSDVLRPSAIDKLRPLAGYLRANAGVRVAIDGYADARGTDAHNLDLSQRRAASVRNALAGLGADRARFTIVGHGERDPVATNATAEGMRQNRRVEVTLLGRRADEFARY